MQIYSTISRLKDQYKNIVIALGTFDGIHIGHQNIIRQAISLAKKLQGTSMVFTFSNHPLSIIAPEKCPPKINSSAMKVKLLQDMGLDLLVDLPFTKELLMLSPVAFLQMLYDCYEPNYLISGPNYSFGYRGEGNPDFLLHMEKKFGYIAQVQPAVRIENSMVSSTLIRELITQGNISDANRLLGRAFSIEGKVVHGDQRGRTLGFPTANLNIPSQYCAPKNGVYIAKVLYNQTEYQAIANVGVNPTFKGFKRHLETHIFDFSTDIYGETITVRFLEKLRSEKKFKGVEFLKTQIQADIKKSKEYFNLQS